MPFAVFKTVREVSSEDAVHTASNLLKQQPGKTWKTKTPGEKSAYVILEFDGEPQQITGIDIGNEHSAFVEVLVGKANSAREDFTEILITCSFMTPIESRNSETINRVRCFGQDALVPSAAANKWQLLKIVCTQPFNKHVQYGLSFIKVHVREQAKQATTSTKSLVPEKFLQRKLSVESNENGSGIKPKAFGLGKFTLREDSPDSESENTTSLFKRWQSTHNSSGDSRTATSTAAAIRQASSPAALKRLSDSFAQKPQCTLKTISPASVQRKGKSDADGDVENENDTKPQVRDRNRACLLFGNDDVDDADDQNDAKKQRLSKHIEEEKARLRRENDKLKQTNTHTKHADEQKPSSSHNRSSSSSSKESKSLETAKKRHSSPSSRPAKKPKTTSTVVKFRPFNQLLQGVVLVISGIQNPDRADLRSKALAMGAKYKTDWESSCTHLICAFKNTPKYNQVRGKGKIITRSWIEKCYALKKYLPWRRFALDSADLAQAESDEEVLDETLKPITIADDEDAEKDANNVAKDTADNAKRVIDKNHTLAMYDLGESDDVGTQLHSLSSGSDTDDEIERVKKKNNLSNSDNNKQTTSTSDIYDVTTEEEDYLKDKLQLMNSKPNNFFKNFIFYICDDVSSVNQIKLEKLIENYGGQLTKELSEAHYALSDNALTKSTATAVFTGETVRPLWIFECNDMEAKVPIKRYLV